MEDKMEEADINLYRCIKNSLAGIKYNLGENIVIYESFLSLECIALTRVAISFWEHHLIRDKISRCFNSQYEFTIFGLKSFYHDSWNSIEDLVVSRSSEVILPITCRQILKDRIKSVGMALLRYLLFWFQLRMKNRRIVYNCCTSVCWTYQGTVNYQKSAAELIECPSLSTVEKYTVACNTCLEEKIYELHSEVPDTFINNITYINNYRLVLFWTSIVRDDLEYMFEICSSQEYINDIYSYMFTWSVSYKNEIAVQYFWSNYGGEEMVASLSENASYLLYKVNNVDILCYLFTLMSPDQIRKACQNDLCEMMIVLLNDWRWHEIFVPAAQYIINHIHFSNYWHSFRVLFEWNETVFERGQYEQVFTRYMDLYGEHITADYFDDVYPMHLPVLFTKDVKLINLFLNRDAFRTRKKLVYNTYIMKECVKLVENGQLKVFETFMKAVIKSKARLDDFKEHFLRKNGFYLCFILISKGFYSILEFFLNMFCVKTNINHFKYNFIMKRHHDVYITLNTFPVRKNFLTWCLEKKKDPIKHKEFYYNKLKVKFKPLNSICEKKKKKQKIKPRKRFRISLKPLNTPNNFWWL